MKLDRKKNDSLWAKPAIKKMRFITSYQQMLILLCFIICRSAGLCKKMQLQLGAVLTQSCISWYCIQHSISILRLWCCPCPIRWVWQHRATSNIGSPCIPVTHTAVTKADRKSEFVIRTLHDCPSQMNENLLISNSKLTSDSELIWWR